MRTYGLLIATAALALAPAPLPAAETATELTGVAVTVVDYTPSDQINSGYFTLRNDRAKPIIFVQVRCTITDGAGQTLTEGAVTVQDVGVGKTTIRHLVAFPAKGKVEGKMACVPFDLFE